MGRYAHAGMLRGAQTIKNELEANGVLESIFSAGGQSRGIRTPLSEVRALPVNKTHVHKFICLMLLVFVLIMQSYSCTDYQLMITGHSLGAGTAAVLSLLLRGKYPSLRCIAFGTPGSVFDKQLAEGIRILTTAPICIIANVVFLLYCYLSSTECQSFITSVALGNDLVCRLSFVSLCRLRNDVLDAISRARVNKMLIMQALFKEIASEDLMYPKGAEPDSKFKSGVQSFKVGPL